jgi:hypothetical protein
MNIKLFFIFIILLAFGGIGGFVAGKASKNIETVDHLSVSLKQFQNKIQALQDQFTSLKQELAKKTGIIIKDSPINPDTTLVKADELIKQGQLGKATLYFSNALSQFPGDWNVIKHYQQSILEYCQQLHQQGDDETVLNILADMDVFIRTQATTVNVQALDKLATTLASIADFRKTVTAAKIAKDRDDNSQFIKGLLINVEQLFQQKPTQAVSSITPYLDKLKDNLLTLQSVDNSTLPANELSAVNSRIEQLKKMIAAFKQQLIVLQQQSVVSSLVEKTKALIKKVQNEPPNSHLILYYLNLIDSLINQLVLSSPDTKEMKIQIAQFSEELDGIKQNLAKAHSQVIWDEIEKTATEQLKIAKDTKAQDAIVKLAQLRQFFAEKSSGLTSLEFLEKAKALREKIEITLAEWQNQQVHSYNVWAIDRIQYLYNNYRNQLGTGTDEEVVYAAMIDLLGDIDTRYLSTPTMTAYNEVFQKFYAELNDKQKILLSSRITLITKTPLSNF